MSDTVIGFTFGFFIGVSIGFVVGLVLAPICRKGFKK